MPGSAHYEKIAFALETTSGVPPVDAAAWVANGFRMSPLRGSLDVSSIGAELIPDERTSDDVYDELPGQLGIDNPEFSFDSYMTTLGAPTAVDTAPVTTVFGRVLNNALGGSYATETTTLAGGGHTTTVVNVLDAAARGIVPGSFVAIEIAGWAPGPTLCHPRRVLAVAGNTALTLDQPLPIAPSDGEVCRGAVADFPDSSVLEDSAVGPTTLSWLLQRGPTGGSRNWLVRGAKAELGSLSFERNNYVKTSFKVMGGSSAGPNEAPSPLWTAIPSDDPPASVGRATHPTVKPIALIRWLVTPPGGTVLDPLMGSGSTGCAAALEGMDFIGCELAPKYVRSAEFQVVHWGLKAGRDLAVPIADDTGLIAGPSRLGHGTFVSIPSEKGAIANQRSKVWSVGTYRSIVDFRDLEWSQSSELGAEGNEHLEQLEQAPSDTADRHMAQMLAKLPGGGDPAAESPASAGLAADEGTTQALSDTDRHMAQMLTKLPGAARPAAGSPSTAGDPGPLATSSNSAVQDDRSRSHVGKLDISSWGLPFQDLINAADESTFEPGQSIDRYMVIEEIGAGAMGAVLKAYDAELDRAVAIKLLHAEVDEEDTARLRREAQALARLSHPNVVQVYDVGEIDGKTFVAMELVKGQTLREWMEKPDQPRAWRECVDVYLQAGAGLAAAHEAGLIHRDFKPDNAIIDTKGKVRVLDFGMARRTRRTTDAQPEYQSDRPADLAANDLALETSLTNPGTIMGTPLYMPLEQWRGEDAGPHSDQFSFCVALYEALYGERPFGGKTIYELEDTLAEGRVPPPDPKGPVVPSRVRNVVLRGLSSDRSQRWHSMDDLLAELRRLAAPRGRRYIARALTVGLAAIAGSTGFLGYLEMKDRCTGALAQMDGIWDDDRRQTVEAAILGTEVSYAPGTWTRVEQQLDDYANAWMDKHTEVCEATSVRGEQSEEAMRLRMRCLSKRRTSLRASVAELANINPKTVENAVKLASSLPKLPICDDLNRLEQQDQLMPPPEDPSVATEVKQVREHLAAIEAMGKAGRYAKGLEQVESVMQWAKELGYPPLLANAQYWRGNLRNDNGQYVEAEQDLRRAYTRAVEHRHDDVALDTAQRLTFVVGVQLARHDEGQQWGEMVSLPLAQRSKESLELAESLNTLGNVSSRHGKYEEAKRYYRKAVRLRQEAFGADHPDVATILDNLGVVLKSQGKYEEAKAYHQRALAIREKALGPDHPNVAYSLNNLGDALDSQGKYKEARVHHQRALRIRERVLGVNHPLVADSLNNLGIAYSNEGEYEEAKSRHKRALEIREESLSVDHPDVAMSLDNLGTVYLDQGKYEAAKAHYERALKIREKTLGVDHPNVADSLNNLGITYSSQGEYEEAKGCHKRALKIREKALGPDHPDVAMSLNNLGTACLNQGKCKAAKAHYERALRIREKALGIGHPKVASTLNNLGIVCSSEGEYEEANAHQERALRIQEKALGIDHPDVAYSLVELAKVALSKGDTVSARMHVERAVSVREEATVAPELLAEARFVLARTLWSTKYERKQACTLATQARETLATAEGFGDSEIGIDEVEAWLGTHCVK
ncbi:MAG: tetratricopeptide repeat protein [Myxococcota bacterium]